MIYMHVHLKKSREKPSAQFSTKLPVVVQWGWRRNQGWDHKEPLNRFKSMGSECTQHRVLTAQD